MIWYKKVLTNTYSKEIAVAGVVFAAILMLSVIQLIKGKPFEWRSIEIFSTPDFWHRIFWSAFTFVTLGAILYRIYFYKFLSVLFGCNRSGYRQAKAIIWLGLMCVNYHFFPSVVDIANSVASFVFNSIVYTAYISPLLMICILFGTVIGLITKRVAVAKLIGRS